jgi:glycosyltransferase involved in cell wall biosynthesis/predicted SAM-dependent methyltransferase
MENTERNITTFSEVFHNRNYDSGLVVLFKFADVNTALMATGVIANLKQKHRNLKINVSGNKDVVSIYRNHPYVKETLVSGSEEEFKFEAWAEEIVDYTVNPGEYPEYGLLPDYDILGNIAGVCMQSRTIVYRPEIEEEIRAATMIEKTGLGNNVIGIDAGGYQYYSALTEKICEKFPDSLIINFSSGKQSIDSKNFIDLSAEGDIRHKLAVASNCDYIIAAEGVYFSAGHNLFRRPTLLLAGRDPYPAGNSRTGYAFLYDERGIDYINEKDILSSASLIMDEGLAGFAKYQHGARSGRIVATEVITDRETTKADANINEKIYKIFSDARRPMTIEIVDRDGVLPGYSGTWNGVKIITKAETQQKIINSEAIMHSGAMNRSGVGSDLPGGFTSREATGTLPDPLPHPLLLNLGCGNDIRDGFVNIDLFAEDPKVVRMDIRSLELPDGSADMILASDILEHFSHRETGGVLAEWARVLKPGGEMIIRCPSLRLQAEEYLNGAWDADVASYMIFGGQTNPGDFHSVGFDEQSIRRHLKKAGLETVFVNEQKLPQDKGFINLNMTVRAKKPLPEDEEDKGKVFPEMHTEAPSAAETPGPRESELSAFDFGETTETKPEAPPKPRPSERSAPPYINVVWEGSQFVYHSLALINREHCSNMIDTGLVNLSVVPYEKDTFDPTVNAKYEKIKANDIRHKEESDEEIARLPYVWVRHQWPPKPERPMGAKWIIMQPWEFSKLRKDFVEIFNQADEIWAPSNFTRKSYIDSGIDFNKVQVIPNGIDPELFSPKGDKYNLKTEKTLKFLFVGGTIFRKGIDILLEVYTKMFDSKADVCLIIKDMGGDSFYKGQTAKEKIEEIQKAADSPEIIYIDDYLTEKQMADLYRACDVFVCPYRGEGFSLPTLEAMACGLPVIVTQGGATDDFVDEEVAWLIPAGKRAIGDTIDGVELAGKADILEPDPTLLAKIFQVIYQDPAEMKSAGMLAQRRAREEWTWKRSTRKIFKRLDLHYETKMSAEAADILKDETDGLIIAGRAEREFMREKIGPAQELFVRAIESGDLHEEYLVHSLNRLAQIAINYKDSEKAWEYLEKAEATAPGHPDVAILKTKMYASEEKATEALETITPALDGWVRAKFSSSIGYRLDDLLCMTGDMLMRMEDLESAHKLYTAALELNHENADACYGAGLCFQKSGINEEAKTMFEWAIRLNPRHEPAKAALEEAKDKTAE